LRLLATAADDTAAAAAAEADCWLMKLLKEAMLLLAILV
jgi:hypothetical protein